LTKRVAVGRRSLGIRTLQELRGIQELYYHVIMYSLEKGGESRKEGNGFLRGEENI